MTKRKVTEDGQAMMQTRREAEEFVLRNTEAKSVSKDQINTAIAKVARALWELKAIQRRKGQQ